MTNPRSKQFVWDYWQGMNAVASDELVFQILHPDVVWHGFRPLRHLHGSTEIWSRFWQPLLTAIPDLIRRPYHFIGGQFDGDEWVCGTGDFIGTFANDWQMDGVIIPASANSVHFRFGEFCKVQDERIVEIRIIVDLPDLARQRGIDLLPENYGRGYLVFPARWVEMEFVWD